jgi:L-aspartate oxidase
VYPERIANDVRANLRHAARPAIAPPYVPPVEASAGEWNALRETMYFGVGVERDEAGLEAAIARLRALGERTTSAGLRDAATVGTLVAYAALRRRETRGSHVRADFPATASDERHRSFSTLADLPVTVRSA